MILFREKFVPDAEETNMSEAFQGGAVCIAERYIRITMIQIIPRRVFPYRSSWRREMSSGRKREKR